MKKLLTLATCLSILTASFAFAYEPPETPAGDYRQNYGEEDHGTPYNYGETEHSHTEPEHSEHSHTVPAPDSHFATATIEELHAYDGPLDVYHETYPPEEIYNFEPPLPPPAVPPPRYTSAAVVVMDADTGLVLYGSEHNTRLYPASITKIMTALIVLEHVQDLSERIEFSYNSIWSIPRNSSHIYMDVGETLTVYEALYALMLSSANEVSVALAEHVAGDAYHFADLMNRRAASLGAVNTHFVNPSGLPGNGHVTTAYDMALIMREAVRHPVFVEIIGARRFDIPPTERQPKPRQLLNTNRLIHPGSYFNEWVIGGKTGWTIAAMHTLVTYAERDGRRLIISTLRSEAGGTFRDTLALMSFGFSMLFEERLVFESASYTRMVPVYQNINGEPLNIGYVTLRAGEDLYFKLPVDFDIRELRFDLSIPERVAPPVLAGDSLGRVTVYVQNIRAGEIELLAQNLVLALPPSTEEEPGAGGSENTRPGAIGYYSVDYPTLAAYPGHFWGAEYLLTLALPIAISVLTLIVSVIIVIASRRRRMRKVMQNKYAQYSRTYRYR